MPYNMHTVIRNIVAILIPLILLAPYAVSAQYDSSKIALNIDKEVYSIGMKVNVAGQVLGSFDPNNPVSLTVSSNGKTYHSTSIKLDNAGAFTHQFVLSDDGSIGRNTLEVTHENAHGEISGMIVFEVVKRASVTAQTTKNVYELGEDVVLNGTVSPVLPNSQVIIQVFNPKNNAWTFKSVSTSMISSNGQFSVELGKLDGKLSLLGVYTVKVSYAASTATATTSFSVGSDSTDSESGSQSTSQSTSDSQESIPSKVEVEEKESESTSTATVAKETVIQYEITNNEPEEQEFTYIVLIKDSEGFTVSLSWASGKLSPSQSLTMEQAWLPETPGIYTVEIFVWESFENPLALSPVVVNYIIVE
jgi:hypothetical protein